MPLHRRVGLWLLPLQALTVSACGAKHDDVRWWRLSEIPLEARSACERNVLSGAPALAARLEALAARIEQPPSEPTERTALVRELRRLVIDDLAELHENRQSRLRLFIVIRSSATALENGEPPSPEAAPALRRLAHEVPAEIPRDKHYLRQACSSITQKDEEHRKARPPSAEEVRRGRAAVQALARMWPRATECEALAEPIRSWPPTILDAATQGGLEACHADLEPAVRQCQAEIEPALDAAEYSMIVRAHDFVRTISTIAAGKMARGEAVLVAERLRAFLDALSPPRSELPDFEFVRAELDAFLRHDTDEARLETLRRLEQPIWMLNGPCTEARTALWLVETRLHPQPPVSPTKVD